MSSVNTWKSIFIKILIILYYSNNNLILITFCYCKLLWKPIKKKLSNKNDVISKETFGSQSEIDSILPAVMSFINMVLNGSSVDTSDKKRSSSTLTIAQFLQFNTVKQKNKNNFNETPLRITWLWWSTREPERKVLLRNLTNMG